MTTISGSDLLAIESLRADIARLTAERDEARVSLASMTEACEGASVRHVQLHAECDRWRREFEQQSAARRDDQGGYPGRLSDVVNEAFGLQPVMTNAELLTVMERGLFDMRRDIASRDATIAELRALLAEARQIVEADLGTSEDELRRVRNEDMRTGLAAAIRADISKTRDLLARIDLARGKDGAR